MVEASIKYTILSEKKIDCNNLNKKIVEPDLNSLKLKLPFFYSTTSPLLVVQLV